MKLAVISDIHSNHYALSSVLEDIEARDVDTIICTGDLVGYMPFPNEVVNLIRKHKILSIKGNHDQHVAAMDKLTKAEFELKSIEEIQQSASALYSSFTLTEVNRAYLDNLPEFIELTVGSYHVLFVHGSPRAMDEYMFEDSDELEVIARSVPNNVLISGHTHLPYHKRIANTDMINAGSVGKSKHGNANGTYVILNIAGAELTSEIIEVCYKVTELVDAISQNPYISDKLIPLMHQ